MISAELRNSCKICLVSLNPERSGQLTSILSLARELEDRSYKVNVLTPLYYGNSKGFLDKQELLPTRRFLFRSFLPLIRIIFEQKKYDLIQLHLPTPGFTLLSDFLSVLLRKPLVVSFESCLIRFNEIVRKQIFLYPKFYLLRALINNRLLSRISFRWADYYIVSSQSQKKELLSLGFKEQKIKVISNMSHSFLNETKIKVQNNDLDNTFILAYAGHFYPNKGIESLLLAMPQIAKSVPNVKLFLADSGIGDTKYKNYLYKLIDQLNLKNKIELKGRVNIQNFLNEIDVLVLPYLYGAATMCYPNLVLEAFNLGTPIISTRTDIMEEMRENEMVDQLAEINNPESLAKGIIEILKHKRQMSGVKIDERLKALNELANNNIDQHLILYKQALSKTDGKRKYYSDDKQSEKYDQIRFAGRSGQWVNQRELTTIISFVPKNAERILDFPSGTGRVLNVLRKQIDKPEAMLVGCDLSMAMLKMAQSKDDDQTFKLIQADLLNIPFKQCFDVIISSRLVFHFKDLTQTLQPLVQSLKKGGVLIFDTQRRSLKSRMPFLRNSLFGKIYIHSDQDVKKSAQELGMKIEEKKEAFLFSALIYRYLPYPIVRFFANLESKLPEKYCFKVFWKLVK